MSDEIMLFFTLVPCFSEAIELPHLVITAFAVREYSTNRFYRIVDHKISNRFDATNLVIDNHRLRRLIVAALVSTLPPGTLALSLSPLYLSLSFSPSLSLTNL